MARNKSYFSGVPRTGKRDPTQDAVTENIEVLTGQRGNELNRALLYRDLVNLDELKRLALVAAIKRGTSAVTPILGVGVESPGAPVNLQGVGGFTFIAITWDAPKYGGHAYAEVWRADTNVFSTAVMISTEVSNTFSNSVSMGASYYYWVRFVNKANVIGPTQGANGLYVETQQSAETILAELGGKIENSHLGDFLSTEVGKIAGIDSDVTQLNLDMPQLLIDVPKLVLDMPQLLIDVPQLMLDVPPLKLSVPLMEAAVFGVGGVVETAKQQANDAKATSEAVLSTNEALALNLIDASLISDINWGSNTAQLVALNASINGIQATISSNFYTMAEADIAIAAAATTIQTMIEENGTTLSGDIATTYYTKTTTDSAIAAANTALKTAIEDPLGASIGATLNDSYYTAVDADSAIATAGDTLKTAIENPEGTSLGATLFTNHYTKTTTDEAIAQADLVLKTAIENTTGTSLGATLYNGYLTSTDTNSAISEANTALKAAIENPLGTSLGADLQTNYYTKTTADEATAASITALKTAIEDPLGLSIGADLINNFYTKTTADEAIASANTALLSAIEGADGTSIGALLASSYYTSTKANEVISSANTALKTAIEDPLGLSIGADLHNNYYTQVTADEAISAANTALQAAIENPVGDSIGADLQTNYYTKVTADTAISEATLQLKTEIENPTGSSIGADLQENYYTKVTANSAIAEANLLLKGVIENPEGDSLGATLFNLYETKVDNEQSIAKAVFQLNSTFGPALEGMIETALAGDIEAGRQRVIAANFIATQKTFTDQNQALVENLEVLESQFDDSSATALQLSQTVATNKQATARDLLQLSSNIKNVSADLDVNYYTSANADEAISQATTNLKSALEDPDGTSIGADLVNNFYTKTTADTAIATANTTLQALIEKADGTSVGASLQTLSETVATNEGEFTALWGVKTTVAEITASFGLLNDGVDPIFAIKGAKLAVITEQDPTVLTPVFGVVGGNTVIKSALIDEAHIQTLVTDDLLSNRIVVGSELNTPSINYNRTTGARTQNFSVDPSGNMVAKSAALESVTIKDAQGNVVMSSTGAVPSTNVTGLGSLATLNALAYDSLTSKPTLGSFAALNSLGYNSLTGKPTLGSLAALSSLAYNDVTGKPTLGPFAGLAKLLSTNVSTYIESGAIGSAQINQAYIGELFGANASFSGTVYANKIDGDVTDVLVKTSTAVTGSGTTTILTFNVASLPFVRSISVGAFLIIGEGDTNGTETFNTTTKLIRTSGSVVEDTSSFIFASVNNVDSVAYTRELFCTIPANTARAYNVTFTCSNSLVKHNAHKVAIRAFQGGSTLS